MNAPDATSPQSRGLAEYADKLLSAMRYEFGGHIEKPASRETT